MLLHTLDRVLSFLRDSIITNMAMQIMKTTKVQKIASGEMSGK